MLHITLGPARPVDPNVDELGRSRVGFDENMTAQALYEANRGCWVLGARADREQYALVSFDQVVQQAIAIDRIVLAAPGRSRRAIEGRILVTGDPVYDAYVNKPTPVGRVRNPITYFEAPVGRRLCFCGCGEEVSLGHFLSGHDQRAIHERIARVGTVVDFLRWFDRNYPDSAAA